MFKLIPKKVNNSFEKVSVNLTYRSLTMLLRTPQNFTTCLKNNCIVNLVEHSLVVGIHGNTLPWSCRNMQGFEKSKKFHFLDLIWLAVEARLHVLHDVVSHIRP